MNLRVRLAWAREQENFTWQTIWNGTASRADNLGSSKAINPASKDRKTRPDKVASSSKANSTNRKRAAKTRVMKTTRTWTASVVRPS